MDRIDRLPATGQQNVWVRLDQQMRWDNASLKGPASSFPLGFRIDNKTSSATKAEQF
jgi:hypothetical protein